MKPTKEQIREAYKRLSLEEEYLIKSNESADLISTAFQKERFTEEQADQADSEILYALLGLQTIDESMKNISSFTQKPIDELYSLKAKLETEIFDKLEKLKKNAPKKEAVGESTLKEDELSKKPGVPSTTPSKLPMVEENEVVHDVPHQESSPPSTAPSQPVAHASTPDTNSKPSASEEPVQTKEKPKPDYKSHYPTGQDPYREPI